MVKPTPAAQQTAWRVRRALLITVLLITAILVGLTTQILSSHNLVINQHQNTFEHTQALQYVLGLKNWCGRHSMMTPELRTKCGSFGGLSPPLCP